VLKVSTSNKVNASIARFNVECTAISLWGEIVTLSSSGVIISVINLSTETGEFNTSY